MEKIKDNSAAQQSPHIFVVVGEIYVYAAWKGFRPKLTAQIHIYITIKLMVNKTLLSVIHKMQHLPPIRLAR